MCAVQAQVARRVGRIHAREAARDDGFVSTKAFLRERLCLNPSAGSALVKASAGLGSLTDTRAALAAGEISVEHADPNQLRDLVRELALTLMSQEEATKRQAKLHAGRKLSAAKTFAGAVAVPGILDPVQGEALLAALADICGIALAATDRPTTGGDRPQVTVTVSLEALQRRGHPGPARWAQRTA